MGVLAITAFRRRIHSRLGLRLALAMFSVSLVLGVVLWVHHMKVGKAGNMKLELAHKQGLNPASPTPEQLIGFTAQNERAPHSASNNRLEQSKERSGLSYFAGTWKNADASTKGLTTLRVRTEGESVWVHAWEKCHPTDCDWGEVPASAVTAATPADPTNDAEKVRALFQTSYSDTVMTLSPSDDDTLEAETQTRFTDSSGRLSYATTYTFRH